MLHHNMAQSTADRRGSAGFPRPLPRFALL